MSRGGSNRTATVVGAMLFCTAGIANFVRIARGGSFASTLELYVVHEPSLLVELLLALLLVFLVVEGAWTTRTVAVLGVTGVVTVLLSVSGLYGYWEFSAASTVPVTEIVWLFLAMELLGGLLVLTGTARELRDRTGARITDAA